MKKIIALIVALSLIIFSFAVAVYADDTTESTMTSKDYYAAQAYLVAKFKDGNITYSEFQEQSQAVTDSFVEANTVGGVLTQSALTASNTFNAVAQKIGETVSNFGDSAKDYISDWISDFLDDYSVFSDKSTTDIQGYGALAIFYPYNTTTDIVFYFYSNEYGTYNLNDGLYSITAYGGGKRDYYYKGNCNDTSVFSGTYSVSGYYAQFFGDWRDPDDTTLALPTDDDFTTVKDYDFSDTSEQDLQELLNDILEELERQQPDLSTVEGLLKSIYNRLGTLDSDNDNALLNDINLAILSLMKSNDDNAKEIAEALLGIREDLKNGTSSDSSDDSSGTNSSLGSHNHDTISGTLYNVKPIDKNFLNKLFTDTTELKVEYDGKNYYLEPCGCLKIDDKYYSVDMNYDSFTIVDYDFSNEYFEIDRSKYVDVDFNNYGKMWSNLSTTQKNKINSVVDLIYKMVEQAVPYSTVTTTLQLYQLVIFNTATPEDIVLTFKPFDLFGTTVDGFEVTILSTSFFANENVANAMKIVKSFLTVVIGYAWLLVMRKKVTAMMG